MVCARLSVISMEQSHQDVSPYGGEAEFDYGQTVRHWKVRFTNTPDAQEFTIELERGGSSCP